MIRSMTGFANESLSTEKYDIFLEIKSLNSKFFELKIRGSDLLDQWENEVRKIICERLKKGKVELYVKIVEKTGENYNVSVNVELARKFEAALKKLSNSLSILPEISLRDFVGLGYIFDIERVSNYDGMYEDFLKLLNKALDRIIEMMCNEAEKIKSDIKNSISLIRKKVSEIEAVYPEAIEKYKEGLREKIKEMFGENFTSISNEIVNNRVMIEAELFASRIAINEEIIRLKSHIDQFLNIVDSSSEDARKLDFIAQEMFREINTISAKSSEFKIIDSTISIKAEIEKIREHLRNVV
ncbi:MAG: YicC/YloC family endoribonuclease [Brevinematia bacterium]